jgi:hypothetical protein
MRVSGTPSGAADRDDQRRFPSDGLDTVTAGEPRLERSVTKRRARNGEGYAMLLSDVPIDDEHVPALAALLNPVLAEKLIVAHTLRSGSVALTAAERFEILRALVLAPGKLLEVREVIFREESWRRGRAP